MDQPKYTTLTETLKSVPDPRHARGKRHPWLFLLALIAAALARGQNTVNAIADWAKLHADELRDSLQPPKGRMPSGSTFYRTVRAIDLPALEAELVGSTGPLASENASSAAITTPEGKGLQGKPSTVKWYTVRKRTANP